MRRFPLVTFIPWVTLFLVAYPGSEYIAPAGRIHNVSVWSEGCPERAKYQ